METLRRIVFLIFRPAAEWDAITREKSGVDVLLRRYVLPLPLLAPIGFSRSHLAALKASVYAAIPVLLAGATLRLSAMIIVGMAGLCPVFYLYWVGANRVLAVRAEYQTEFIGISIVLPALVSVVSGAIASSIGLI